MSEYKSGALSAFLGGQSVNGKSPKSKNALFDKKVVKKIKKQSEPTVVEENRNDVDEKLFEKSSKRKRTASSEAATTSGKRKQSYEKVMTDEENKKTIFVGNLPSDITKKALKRLFTEYGPIETIRLRSAIPNKLHLPKKAAVIKRELSEGHNTLNAYVKFQEAESVQGAVKMNGHLIEGRHMQVDSCASGKRYDDKRTVFLGNLPFDANEEELYKHFSDCGGIEKVRLVRNRITGEGKGFGFVVFNDPTSVSFALKLNGEKFENRELRITRIIKKHKLNTSASNFSKKNKRKDETKSNRWSTNKSKEYSTTSSLGGQEKKKPSKRIRELVKKRKSKKDKKSYMSTF